MQGVKGAIVTVGRIKRLHMGIGETLHQHLSNIWLEWVSNQLHLISVCLGSLWDAFALSMFTIRSLPDPLNMPEVTQCKLGLSSLPLLLFVNQCKETCLNTFRQQQHSHSYEAIKQTALWNVFLSLWRAFIDIFTVVADWVRVIDWLIDWLAKHKSGTSHRRLGIFVYVLKCCAETKIE